MDKVILHIDVNNAFLSWSAVDLLNNGYKIDIREIEAVIGGDEANRHGIVLAKSNMAKKKGVITGESLYQARKKCPNLKIYPPQYTLYQEMSNKLFTLLYNYTPDIEVFSIDECFIDYTGIKKIYGDELEFASKIKTEIKNELGFTVNVGIGNNKLCAKMASDFLKPDRIHTLYKDEIKNKMWSLPIESLYGVGKKTSPKIRSLGINTIGDLANYDHHKLTKYFKSQAIKLINNANGIDDSSIVTHNVESKGISNSTTLEKDLKTKEEIYEALYPIAESLGLTLRQQGRFAYVVAVILKDNFFRSYSKQTKLKNATNSTSEIYDISKRLLNEMWDLTPIRLVGIRLDNLVKKDNYQTSLFEDLKKRDFDIKLDKAVDCLKNKYGPSVIKRASRIIEKK
jgi:DNA polymerase IV